MSSNVPPAVEEPNDAQLRMSLLGHLDELEGVGAQAHAGVAAGDREVHGLHGSEGLGR